MRRLAATLLALLISAPLTLPAAIAAPPCPTSIDQAIAVSEPGDSQRYAPSDLPRSFPDVDAMLAPGSSGSDAGLVHAVTDLTLDLKVRLRGDPIEEIPQDQDLVVSILWNGRTVARAGYTEVLGTGFDLGRLGPEATGTLELRVVLPAHGPRDNVTKRRTWPLGVVLGLRASDDACEESPGTPTVPPTGTPTPTDPGAPSDPESPPSDPAPGPPSDTPPAPGHPSTTGGVGGPDGPAGGHDPSDTGPDAAAGEQSTGPLARTGTAAGGLLACALLLLGIGAALRRLSAGRGESS